VFIDLGGVDGLIHITDLSWSRINHPSEVLELDQKLNVVILDFDDEKTRIQLGLKQLNAHPWDALGTELKVIGSECLVNSTSEKTNSWMLIPIYITGANASIRKKYIIDNLESNEIETRPVLTGNFLAQPAIQRITRYAIESKSFNVAQEITEKAFLVGVYCEDHICF
jgi:transcriptional accessory protein Tex/SPT6